MTAQPGQHGSGRRNLRALGLRLVNSVSSSWSLLILSSITTHFPYFTAFARQRQFSIQFIAGCST